MQYLRSTSPNRNNPGMRLCLLDLWRACADINAGLHESAAQPAVAESGGRGRRIIKPETAAFRASFTQAAAAAASTSLVSWSQPYAPVTFRLTLIIVGDWAHPQVFD